MTLPRLPDSPPTYADLGLKKRVGSQCKKIAELPQKLQKLFIDLKNSLTELTRTDTAEIRRRRR